MSAVRSDGRDLSAEDVLRAHLYAFLSRLLGAPPDEETLRAVRRLGRDETPLGRALGSLADTAAHLDPEGARREFDALFIGLTEGEVVPYASYYKTGFLFEKPLAELRADLRRLGVAAREDVAEPEDHVASLFEVMAGLITGRFGAPADLAAQKAFFDAHVASWVRTFFRDLEAAETAALYRDVARVATLFIEIESEAFSMA